MNCVLDCAEPVVDGFQRACTDVSIAGFFGSLVQTIPFAAFVDQVIHLASQFAGANRQRQVLFMRLEYFEDARKSQPPAEVRRLSNSHAFAHLFRQAVEPSVRLVPEFVQCYQVSRHFAFLTSVDLKSGGGWLC